MRSYCLGSCCAPSSCFFGSTYAIILFIDSFFCVSNICSDSFRTLSVWNRKRVFLRRLYSWLSICLQRNFSSLSLYVFPSSDALVLNHHSALQFAWLLNMCSRGTLLASLNSSIFFIYYSLSCTPNLFWAGGHLLWCTRIAYPYFCWWWRIFVLQLPSRDGRGPQGSMAQGFLYQVFLWMT